MAVEEKQESVLGKSKWRTGSVVQHAVGPVVESVDASGFVELVEARKPHPECDYINNASAKRYNFPTQWSLEVVTMRSTVLFCLITGILAIAVPLLSQNVNPMHPEEIHVQKHASPDDIRARVASLQFQTDAKELAELCDSIPGEMNGVNQGLVSKDLLEKLKRVEKLSK